MKQRQIKILHSLLILIILFVIYGCKEESKFEQALNETETKTINLMNEIYETYKNNTK